ncbi:unnamed protein product [Umbelopsis sp. WA50703]
MVIITSILMDVKEISNAKKQVNNDNCVDSVESSTDNIGTSIQSIKVAGARLTMTSSAASLTEENSSHNYSTEYPLLPERTITDDMLLDSRLITPSHIPDSKYQNSTPENLFKEQENVPASVPQLLACTSNIIDISSPYPRPNKSDSKLSLSSTCINDDNGFPDYTEQYVKRRASHKRSFSSVSTSLTMSSQKSMAEVTSKVKRALSKLHRQDASVSPAEELIHKPDPPQRTHSHKIFSHKKLNKLLKRG